MVSLAFPVFGTLPLPIFLGGGASLARDKSGSPHRIAPPHDCGVCCGGIGAGFSSRSAARQHRGNLAPLSAPTGGSRAHIFLSRLDCAAGGSRGGSRISYLGQDPGSWHTRHSHASLCTSRSAGKSCVVLRCVAAGDHAYPRSGWRASSTPYDLGACDGCLVQGGAGRAAAGRFTAKQILAYYDADAARALSDNFPPGAGRHTRRTHRAISDVYPQSHVRSLEEHSFRGRRLGQKRARSLAAARTRCASSAHQDIPRQSGEPNSCCRVLPRRLLRGTLKSREEAYSPLTAVWSELVLRGTVRSIELNPLNQDFISSYARVRFGSSSQHRNRKVLR